MRHWSDPGHVLLVLGAFALSSAAAQAQQHLALKSGESVVVGSAYYVVNCRSIMVGTPELEVLESPDLVTLSLKEEKVVPRRHNCTNQVPGGTVVLTAKQVNERVDGKLTYRIKYKTKDGDRQTSTVYTLSLHP